VALVACGDTYSDEPAIAAGDPATAAVTDNLDEEPHPPPPCPPCQSAEGRPPLGDFNGDGISDILWRNSQTGEMRVWVMDTRYPTLCAGEVVLAPPTPDPGWKIKGTGDFDGDGDTDILWQNDTSHRVVIWIMRDTTHIAGGYVDCGPEWLGDFRIAGTGHYNEDSKADILWQHVSDPRELWVWYMDGLTCKGDVGPMPDGKPEGNWNSSGGGYFDDGTHGLLTGSDVLWRNSDSGRVVIWYMDGFERTGGVFTVPDGSAFHNSREIVGIGRWATDDYCSDVLWRSNDTGSLSVWTMTGNIATSLVPVQGCGTTATEANWAVVGPH